MLSASPQLQMTRECETSDIQRNPIAATVRMAIVTVRIGLRATMTIPDTSRREKRASKTIVERPDIADTGVPTKRARQRNTSIAIRPFSDPQMWVSGLRRATRTPRSGRDYFVLAMFFSQTLAAP